MRDEDFEAEKSFFYRREKDVIEIRDNLLPAAADPCPCLEREGALVRTKAMRARAPRVSGRRRRRRALGRCPLSYKAVQLCTSRGRHWGVG